MSFTPLKKPGRLPCRVFHILDLARCFLVVCSNGSSVHFLLNPLQHGFYTQILPSNCSVKITNGNRMVLNSRLHVPSSCWTHGQRLALLTTRLPRNAFHHLVSRTPPTRLPPGPPGAPSWAPGLGPHFFSLNARGPRPDTSCSPN